MCESLGLIGWIHGEVIDELRPWPSGSYGMSAPVVVLKLIEYCMQSSSVPVHRRERADSQVSASALTGSAAAEPAAGSVASHLRTVLSTSPRLPPSRPSPALAGTSTGSA